MKLILNGLALFLACYFSLLAPTPMSISNIQPEACCCSGSVCSCDSSVKSCCSNTKSHQTFVTSACGDIEVDQVFSISLLKHYCFTSLLPCIHSTALLFMDVDMSCDMFLLSKKIDKPPQFHTV